MEAFLSYVIPDIRVVGFVGSPEREFRGEGQTLRRLWGSSLTLTPSAPPFQPQCFG